MTYNLPPEFLERMEKMLGEEYPAFLASYGEDRIGGLRINGLKADEKTLDRLASWKLSPVPWCPSGYYYQEGRPGLHPWHEAGLYYIQEPSAMIVGELAACRPGERVLDLGAARGGITTDLACMM